MTWAYFYLTILRSVLRYFCQFNFYLSLFVCLSLSLFSAHPCLLSVPFCSSVFVSLSLAVSLYLSISQFFYSLCLLVSMPLFYSYLYQLHLLLSLPLCLSVSLFLPFSLSLSLPVSVLLFLFCILATLHCKKCI